ncbi:hypothetical protein ACLOJK_032912 [Asimina triloba]
MENCSVTFALTNTDHYHAQAEAEKLDSLAERDECIWCNFRSMATPKVTMCDVLMGEERTESAATCRIWWRGDWRFVLYVAANYTPVPSHV